MDIAKYIGLFLLKNNICYIPGMGNLEIKKVSASHDGTALQAPAYEVKVTPSGSIDDSLANFIATNEKISIANASNGIRTFATESKAVLNAGGTVVIPSLGYFTEADGKLQFVTDAGFRFTPAPIPTVKHATRITETSKPASASQTSYTPAPKTNWGKTALIGIIAGAALGAILAGVVYVNNSSPSPEAETVVTESEPVVAEDTLSQPAADTAQPAPANISNNGQYKVILNTYTSREKAEKRFSKLTNFGNAVEMVQKDSSTYHILLPVTGSLADTAHVLDSLKALFNPNGVSIYR